MKTLKYTKANGEVRQVPFNQYNRGLIDGINGIGSLEGWNNKKDEYFDMFYGDIAERVLDDKDDDEQI